MALPIKLVPVPCSPQSRTGVSESAASRTASYSCSIFGLQPNTSRNECDGDCGRAFWRSVSRFACRIVRVSSVRKASLVRPSGLSTVTREVRSSERNTLGNVARLLDAERISNCVPPALVATAAASSRRFRVPVSKPLAHGSVCSSMITSEAGSRSSHETARSVVEATSITATSPATRRSCSRIAESATQTTM